MICAWVHVIIWSIVINKAKTFDSEVSAIQFILGDIENRKPKLDEQSCQFRCLRIEFSNESFSLRIMDKILEAGLSKNNPDLEVGLGVLIKDITEATNCQGLSDRSVEFTTIANSLLEQSSHSSSIEGSGLIVEIEHKAEIKTIPG